MNISYNWLSQYVDISCGVETLAAKLTMAGIEVEAIERSGGMPQVKMTQVRRPGYVVNSADYNMIYLRPTMSWENDTDMAFRHNGRANFLMLDGHVESFKIYGIGIYMACGTWTIDTKRWNDSW